MRDLADFIGKPISSEPYNSDDKIRVLMPSQVPRLDDDVELFTIGRELNAYIKAIKPRINFSDLGDWRLLMCVCIIQNLFR
ncbi:hypothetical protein Flavo103_10610 [Flavobacterium collinsii]|uniref:Imm9 family immunity protein n=1 Tax=Flavobacterium collinsii TaxID=1114861 RepID=UPI0022C65D1C|nr:hypothetical protein Flavo103_10610 [Flavobacterium collinsii]